MPDDDDTTMRSLLEIMARLRDPHGGCPWDLAQRFSTIAPYTIEEAYEVADAIVRDDMHDLCDELGDLLFQVVFHARMAEERGAFGFADVVSAICAKMRRRHPHVFGDAPGDDIAQVNASWEAIKAAERNERGHEHDSELDGITPGMGPLRVAGALQKRAARVGFDWPQIAGVIAKVREELEELEQAIDGEHPRDADGDDDAPESAREDAVAGEVGDLLFSAVNLARHLGVDPELALSGSNRRFEQRFRHMESAVGSKRRSLSDLTIDELEALWHAAKRDLSLARR